MIRVAGGWDAPHLIPMLDPRWFGLIIRGGDAHLLTSLLLGRKNAPEVLEQMGAHMYQLALTGDNHHNTDNYIRLLRDLGWTDWKDFFVIRGRNRGEFIYLELKMGLELIPVSLEEKISQLERLTALARQNKVAIRYYHDWPEEDIQQWITQWKTEQARERLT